MSTDKKVVFVTGGNTGLGYEIVKALFSSTTPYEIIIGCRTPAKGEEAVTSLKQGSPNSASSLSVIQTDLTSDESLEKTVEHLSSKYGHLDILINNGGAQLDDEHFKHGRMTLRQVINADWDVNVTGTHCLTMLAAPLLLKSNDPRLLFLTSGTSSLAESERFDGPVFQRLNKSPEKGWPKPIQGPPATGYRTSKCGLNMLMREWARMLRNDGVKVWAVSPGFLATNLGDAGAENLKKLGAQDPSVGGRFVKAVCEGERDGDVGKVIRESSIQDW